MAAAESSHHCPLAQARHIDKFSVISDSSAIHNTAVSINCAGPPEQAIMHSGDQTGSSRSQHNVKGQIDIIMGPMFAGKTSELLRRVEDLEVYLTPSPERSDVVNSHYSLCCCLHMLLCAFLLNALCPLVQGLLIYVVAG
jgi:hypothetical protein